MSLISTVTTTRSVSPMLRPLPPDLLGEPAGEQAGERLALLLAVDDGPVQQPQAVQRALAARGDPCGELDEDRLDLGVDGLGRMCRATAIALIGLPSATMPSSSSSAGGEAAAPWSPAGRSASTIAGSSAVPPVATARIASTSWLPSATWSFSR